MVIKWCVVQKTIEFPYFVLGFYIYNVRAAYIHASNIAFINYKQFDRWSERINNYRGLFMDLIINAVLLYDLNMNMI